MHGAEFPYQGSAGFHRTIQGDAAGRLWFVLEGALLRWDDAESAIDGSPPDARLEAPGTMFLGQYDDGSDRAFLGNWGQIWIWNDASTRVGTDMTYDEEFILIEGFDVADGRLVMVEPEPQYIGIYDPATLSADSPDPIATIDTDGYINPIHLWGNLVFAAYLDTVRIYDLDDQSLLAEIPYEPLGPPMTEMLYTSNGTLYMVLFDVVEVWTNVPDNPTLTQTLAFDPMLRAGGLGVYECLVDDECAPGRCISGKCTAT